MNHDGLSNRSRGGRVQWGGYGFLAGILIGLMLGWLFHGFVGAFIRVGLVALVVVPVILIYVAWRKFIAPLLRPTIDRRYAGPMGAIETTAVVHEPRAR